MAASAAAVIALASALIVSRGTGDRSSPLGPRPTHRSTASPQPLPGNDTQQVTYRRLAVQVPANWQINDALCGSPRGNTVLLPTFVVATCIATPARGITWVSFDALGSYACDHLTWPQFGRRSA